LGERFWVYIFYWVDADRHTLQISNTVSACTSLPKRYALTRWQELILQMRSYLDEFLLRLLQEQ
jgi:hypothetical protein